jgi:hypothetical protein
MFPFGCVRHKLFRQEDRSGLEAMLPAGFERNQPRNVLHDASGQEDFASPSFCITWMWVRSCSTLTLRKNNSAVVLPNAENAMQRGVA